MMTTTPPRPDAPLVVVCLRITDLRPRVDPLTGVISHDPWGIGWPAADAAALEHGLRVAEAWRGRVLAVAAGPPGVEPLLVEARALGADVLRIALDETGDRSSADELTADEHGLARRIAGTLGVAAPPALVLCGDRSVDRGTGALPAFLAHELGAAQALGLVRLDVVDDHGRPSDRILRAERRLDGGWRERLEIPLPAVCSVEAAGVALRRAPLAAALASADEPVPVARADRRLGEGDDHPLRVGPTRPFRPRPRVLPAPTGHDPRARLLALSGALDAHDPPVVVGPVGAGAAADALLDFLVRHGYLDAADPADRHSGADAGDAVRNEEAG